MQLFLNATSPFARLARVVALEKNLSPTLVWCDPWNNDPAVLAVHPQGRIPVLLTPEGHALSESLLIAQYLDSAGSGAALVPIMQSAAVLAHVSVGYGVMEAAFATVIGRKHEGASQDSSVMGARRLAALQRGLAWLENHSLAAVPHDGATTLDQLVTAIALEYVQFRLPLLCTPAQYPALCAWQEHAAQRPHLQSTAFA